MGFSAIFFILRKEIKCFFFYNQQGFESCFKWSVLYMNMDLYNHGTLGVASDEKAVSLGNVKGA